MGGHFSIDTDELDAVIADLEATETALEEMLGDLESQMAALQSQWEGLAADAHQEAHQEWTQGMNRMRDALTQIRAASRVAHGNYSGAVETNVSMWQQVR